jgi:phage terminase small subunit
MKKCKAKTTKGKRCSNKALEGSEFCHIKSHAKANQKKKLATKSKKEEPNNKLTNKQILFCEFYIQSWNAADAARKAGYKGNDDTIKSIGSENLTKPYISEFIKKRVKEVTMSTDEALKRLSDWGRASIEHFLEEDDYSGKISVESDGAKRHLGLIKKIKQNERSIQNDGGDTVLHRSVEIELHDAKDAVDKILKVHGAYAPDKLDHTSSDGSMSPKSMDDWYNPDRNKEG